MTTTDPDPQVPSEPTSETTNVVEASAAEAEAKPKHKRKTKAEKEVERMAQAKAEAEKPIDPQVWLLLGGILLFLGVCIYVDPIGFAEAGKVGNVGLLQMILVFVTGFIGKNPTAVILGIVGLLSLGWGVRGWLRKRSGADSEPTQTA